MAKRPEKTARASGKTAVPRKKTAAAEPSQLMELFLRVAGELGFTTDEELARLANVGADNVGNWRAGAVREFKPQRLAAAIESLAFHIQALRAQAGLGGADSAEAELSPFEIETGSSPSDLHRQFRDRVHYDYLGHRFLYFEPQGAVAWENLIKEGYDQDRWLAGVGACAEDWLGGPLGRALGGERSRGPRGVDLISLGPGEGLKEVLILRALVAAERRLGKRLSWVAYAPVDVSIPLLLAAARGARRVLAREAVERTRHYAVLPFCADFEEGQLAFQRRLRTATRAFAADGLRLVAILGNVFGNVRDEEQFVQKKLAALARPGDLLWLEVGVRPDDIAHDPLFHMTRADHEESAGEANRRLLLEGPYRRWAAASGRPAPEVELRVSLREGDESARVPGSVNFIHDLVLRDERRSCTMLYSRRYRPEALVAWFERLGWITEATRVVTDSRGVSGVVHLLLRRL